MKLASEPKLIAVRSPDKQPSKAPARRLWLRLLLVALGAGLGLLACELWARSRYGTPEPERLPLLRVQANPFRGWEMVPSRDHYTYLEQVRVNELGLRGAEVGAKRAGERRILCLGDSLIYGQGVGESETLPAALEAALPADSGTVVINGGLRAYATHQELGLLEELGDRVEPDLVLLCWYWNDVEERDIEETRGRLEQSGPIVFDVSRPWSVARRVKWHAKQMARRSALLNHLHERIRTEPWKAWSEEFRAAGLSRLEGYLDLFEARCAELGAEFRVVLLPDLDGIMGGDVSRDLSNRGAALFEARDFPFLDLRPALNAWIDEHRRIPILPFDGHFNGEGNRLFGRAIADWLTE